MSDIFVSYSRKDKDSAEALCAALASAHSRDVWIDSEDIPPTAKWWAEITSAITAANSFLFLISPTSVSSKTCKAELELAVSLSKRILPLLIKDTLDNEVPPDVASLNWILLRETDDFKAGIGRLIEALDLDLTWVRGHSRLLVRAAEWETHGKNESYLLRGEDLDEAQAWLAGAANKKPEPAPLHHAYVLASQQAQAREIKRLRDLYQNALARQLAAQCALLQRESDASLDRSMLLAVESLRRVPNAEADMSLRRGLRLRAEELFRCQIGAGLLAVSNDGDFIATCDEPNRLVVRDAQGVEIFNSVLENQITAIAFIPDSGNLLVAFEGGALSRVDVNSGQVVMVAQYSRAVHSLLGLPGSAAFLSMGEGGAICYELGGAERWRLALDGTSDVAASSADGKLVAIGASDCTVRVVDQCDGTLKHEFKHDKSRPLDVLQLGSNDMGITAVAFADQDRLLCSAGLDGKVRVWDLNNGQERYAFSHSRDLLCMSINPASNLIASGGLDKNLVVWELSSGREFARVELQGAVTSLVWSGDGGLLSGCGDGTARLWKVNGAGSLTETARCIHDEWVDQIAVSRVGPVSRSWDGAVIVWDRGEADWRGLDHDYSIRHAVCDDDGRYILAFLDAENQILYDTENYFDWRVVKHPDFVDRAWFTRDGHLITICWDGVLREWDVKDLSVRWSQSHGGRIWKAALSSDQLQIVTAVQDEPLARVWRRGAATPKFELPHTTHVRSLAFDKAGDLLATSCDDGSVRAWSLSSGELIWLSTVHQGTAWAVRVAPDGNLVASCGDDQKVLLHASATGEIVHTLDHSESVNGCAFSPDGKLLAVRTSERGPQDLLVWHVDTGEIAARLPHDKYVYRMDWSKDSSLLATAADDWYGRVFEVGSQRERVRLQYSDICGSVRFVPATQELLSTSYDGSLRLSIIDPDQLIAKALARVPRSLTDNEWRRYLPDEPRQADEPERNDSSIM
jgi:WD40 repeat protein